MTSKTRSQEPRYPDLPVGPRLEAVLSLAYRARRPVLLEGPTGIGKSELVQAVAQKLGVGSTVLDLSLLEPPDLVGLPVVVSGRTEYAVPRALPREGAGILMLEELNRAERYIQQPALQLLTARRLHEYELPPGWVCFAAINPETGDYQVTPLDRALRARFLHLNVRADRAAWLSWALTHDVHPAVVELVRAHDRALEEIPPRTWTYVSHLLRSLSREESTDEVLLRDALSGYLSPAWAETLLASREGIATQLGLDVRAVMARYAPGTPEARALRGYRDAGQTDRVDELVTRVLSVVKGPEVGVLAAQGQFALAAFEALLADLPGDQRERLQEAIAQNPVACGLIDVAPTEFLQNYVGSAAEQKLRAWKNEPTRTHRVALAVNGLRAYLTQHARADELRKSNIVRINLGVVLSQLPERLAMPLVETLLKLGITPVRPA